MNDFLNVVYISVFKPLGLSTMRWGPPPTPPHTHNFCPLQNCSLHVISCSASGRDLVNMAKKRPNVIPIIEDARHPIKYRMLVPMVDVIFADVAQPDQARIVGLNAQVKRSTSRKHENYM